MVDSAFSHYPILEVLGGGAMGRCLNLIRADGKFQQLIDKHKH